MKKFLIPLLFITLFLSGCGKDVLNTKTVHVVIPEHPWERYCKIKLWYYLKWNDNGKIQTLYVDKNTREADIEIPKNCTVYICAYPLGEMIPFGCCISPVSDKKEPELTQAEGYIAHLLINTELKASERVNCEKLPELLDGKLDDYRDIDDVTFLSDVLNGRLGISSVKKRNKFSVSDIPLPNGFWVSEYWTDGTLDVKNGKTGELILPVGIHRYYCKELDREFRIVIDANGSVFHSLRYGMTGL